MVDASARLRWFGVLVLGAALLMLVGGQTVLQGKLSGLSYLIYWAFCLIFTGLAIVIALVDARAIRTQIRRQERELIEETIRKIQNDAQELHRKGRK